jgi:hypothetical protein
MQQQLGGIQWYARLQQQVLAALPGTALGISRKTGLSLYETSITLGDAMRAGIVRREKSQTETIYVRMHP